MKGKLAALFLAAIALTWLSTRNSPTCSVCISNLESMLFPPEPVPLPYPPPPAAAEWQAKAPADRLANVRSRLLPRLHEELNSRQLQPGAPAFLRAFKETRELELWLRAGSGGGGGEWILFRNYPIHALSGTLGPKLAEGDGQTPEGLYAVTPGGLNPASRYHLSFNIGYPNEHDRHHRRTGTHIMVHGGSVSVGCLAMSDPAIEEIYLLVSEALAAGQSEVPIHIFPFRMTDERLEAAAGSPHAAFWSDLRILHDRFESSGVVPPADVRDGSYQLSAKH